MLLWCVHAVMLLWCVRAVMLLWCVQTRRTPTWTPRCHNTHTHTHTHTLPQASTDRRVKPYTSNYHQHKFQLPPPQITSTSNIHQRSPTTHTLPLPTHRHQRHPSKATCITITWHQHHAQTTTSSNHLPVAQQTNTYTMPIRLSSSPHMPSPQPPATTAIPLVQRQRCQNICSHTHIRNTVSQRASKGHTPHCTADTLHLPPPNISSPTSYQPLGHNTPPTVFSIGACADSHATSAASPDPELQPAPVLAADSCQVFGHMSSSLCPAGFHVHGVRLTLVVTEYSALPVLHMCHPYTVSHHRVHQETPCPLPHYLPPVRPMTRDTHTQVNVCLPFINNTIVDFCPSPIVGPIPQTQNRTTHTSSPNATLEMLLPTGIPNPQPSKHRHNLLLALV